MKVDLVILCFPINITKEQENDYSNFPLGYADEIIRKNS
jgi:hypothetical protein